jgi:hypothetical protein
MITVGIEKWSKTRGAIANRSIGPKSRLLNRFPVIIYICLIFCFTKAFAQMAEWLISAN